MMNLNDLTLFTRIVEDGSFTAAAERLDLPKSTLSRTLSRLEAHLGVRLLQRTTRSLHLTDAGRQFYDRVRQSLAELAMTVEHLQWFAEEGRRAYGRIIPPQADGKRNLVFKKWIHQGFWNNRIRR